MSKDDRSLCWASLVAATGLVLNSCGVGTCSKYASDYSCSFVENDAEYEVWYWRNLGNDDGADDTLIGRAIGLRMCEDNARAFAGAIGEDFNYRAYICVLMKDGMRMEKHRFIPA